MNEDYIDIAPCSCHDGCLAPMVIRENKNNKYELFGISRVFGMGNALWDKRIFKEEFDEIKPYNSYEGTSYIALCKDNKWGLVELHDNNTIQCEWKLIEEIVHPDLDELLKKHENICQESDLYS